MIYALLKSRQRLCHQLKLQSQPRNFRRRESLSQLQMLESSKRSSCNFKKKNE